MLQPVFLVLSSCALRPRTCASSRRWRAVASSPFVKNTKVKSCFERIFRFLTLPQDLDQFHNAIANDETCRLQRIVAVVKRDFVDHFQLIDGNLALGSRQWWCSWRTRRFQKRRWSVVDRVRPLRARTLLLLLCYRGVSWVMMTKMKRL